ncbi:hypothetical protein [Sporofaciens musculi]|jgi:hypothetical protein|nr:hypothetical protein [Sporofaciens musculi]
MFYISNIMRIAPKEYKNQLQKETYKALADKFLPFAKHKPVIVAI